MSKCIFFLFVFVVLFFGHSALAATLKLSPSSGSFTAGDNFIVNILLDTQSANTDGADIHYLNYPISLLEVQDANVGTAGIQISPGSLFPNTLINEADTANGKMDFSQAAAGGSVYNGSGTLATITFKVLGEGTANVNFDFTAGSTTDTNVASGGQDVLSGVTNGSFTLKLPDTAPPYTTAHNPARGAAAVSPSTNLIVEIKDDGQGVNSGSIVMTVEGSVVTPDIAGSPASYTLTYDPPADFSYEQIVNVTIDARDLASPSNIMAQDAYSFTIAQEPSPPPAPPSGGGGGGGGGGGAPPDTASPKISDIKVTEISSTSAIIVWHTDELATSKVEYGLTETYKYFTPIDNGLVENHSVKIEELTPGTRYYFKAMSKDSSGNQAVSSENTFAASPLPGLIGDFNSDGKVNIFDLSILLSNWKKTKAEYDLNQDGIINIFDLSIFLSNWMR